MAMARMLQRELPGIGDVLGIPDLPSIGDLIPNLDDLSLSDIVDQFAPDTGSIAPNPDCPTDFCAPMSSTAAALALRGAAAGPILAGIAIKVNPRVVNLWRQHIFGGSAPQDLSGDFGSDFESSATTAHVHGNLVNALKADIEANPPTFPPGIDEVTVDIPTRIPAAIAALDDPANTTEQMNFNVISEIPGNIAGGIGKNQASTPVGAQPAPFDDSRTAAGTATVKKNADGTLTITPHITFTVRDTIDLCPGNCGADVEQVATRPLSWLEASGVSGDVPFTVEFPGPATTVTATPSGPPPPAPGPVDGEVRASPHLRIREAPSTASAILGKYPDGTKIKVECQVTGESVLGNDKWDKTDKGFVSDRYVKRTDAPPAC
jgi:hypothetical protein